MALKAPESWSAAMETNSPPEALGAHEQPAPHARRLSHWSWRVAPPADVAQSMKATLLRRPFWR